MIEGKYDLVSDEFKKTLENAGKVSLTGDVWTDTQKTKRYLGVTVHYNDAKCKEVKGVMLDVVPLDDRHTAVNIASALLVALLVK